MNQQVKHLLCIGPSQWPVIRDGSQVEICPVKADWLRAGDLVVHKGRGGQTCHRILYRKIVNGEPWYFIKGDANLNADGWMSQTQIVGRVVSVNGQSVDRKFFRFVSLFFYWHSRLQHRFYQLIFFSKTGRTLGYLRMRLLPKPIFMKLYGELTAPWLSVHRMLDKIWENQHFRRYKHKLLLAIHENVLRPPIRSSKQLIFHGGDYGHSYYYEEIFCDSSQDVEPIVTLLGSAPCRVCDLGGGSGRLSWRLAQEGKQVTLVDRSQTMIALAKNKRRTLTQAQQRRYEICLADIRELQSAAQYDYVISLNNAFEHLESDAEILSVLRGLRKILSDNGVVFIDVHHPPFWEQMREWKAYRWTYDGIRYADGKKLHLWQRTSEGGATNQIVWEHAVKRSHSAFFVHLKTTIRLLPQPHWLRFFNESGFEVTAIWGNWNGTKCGDIHPKVIFRLSKTAPSDT